MSNSNTTATSDQSNEDAEKRSQLAWIEGYVSLTFLLMICLLIVGSLRNRSRSVAVKLFAWVSYQGVTFLIPYILGLMHNASFYHELALVWAVLLLLVYSSVDNMSIFYFEDRFHAIELIVKSAIQLYIVSEALSRMNNNNSLNLPLAILFVAGNLKVLKRAVSLMRTEDSSRKSTVMKISEFIGDDSRHGDEVVGWDPCSDPTRGCKYLVPLHLGKFDVLTIHEIWHCEQGADLLSDDLKDTCLSFSLFWLLFHKFAGVPAFESSHQDEAWNFIRNGLLIQQGEHERPFRVIEAELNFLYDYYYSQYPSLYFDGLQYYLYRQLAIFGGLAWVAVTVFRNYRPQEQSVGIRYHKHDVDVLVTAVVILALTVMELIQTGLFIVSNWTKVRLVCYYIKRESWKRQTRADYWIEKALGILCWILGKRKNECCPPWERKLGQYSLLQSCTKDPFLRCWSVLGFLVTRLQLPISGRGRVESKSIELSDPIKRALILSLLEHGRKLTNGVASLEAGGLTAAAVEKLVWACKLPERDAHVILVWHIATTLCEMDTDDDLPMSVRVSDAFHVATSLSKYCSYLVAFAPELLPGYASMTEITCTEVISYTRKQFKDCDSAQAIFNKMMILAGDNSESEEGEGHKILREGAVLQKNLLTEISDPEQRWKVLAGIWAEMILYLAPNPSNHIAHAEKLASGGELITQLWALLFHAGIVDRECLCSDVATNVRT